MYYESNMLISPKLDNSARNELQNLSKKIVVPSDKEIEALIYKLEGDQPFLTSITIGTSQNDEMITFAYKLKENLESYWYETKGYDIYVNIVIWKDHLGSSKKFVKKFLAREPDSWIVLGSQVGFSNMIKRLYHHQNWKEDRTYCLNSLLSQSMVNIVGQKYFEGLKGVTYHGEYWKVIDGKITIYS